MSTTSPPYPPPTPGGGYALRAVVVADSLEDLHGPAHGEVRLPLHLDASARQGYDLDRDYFRRLVYRLVLLEAATVEDLTTWLDRDALVRDWPGLYLPRASCGPPGSSATRSYASAAPAQICPGPDGWVSTPFRPRSRALLWPPRPDRGFALAGGNALVAHGLVERVTQDVDLFSPEPGAPGAVAPPVRRALETAGYRVEVTRRPEDSGGEFAELAVGRGEQTVLLDLARDWRNQPPIRLDVGPVLHLDDAVGSKVTAMVGRGDSDTTIKLSGGTGRRPRDPRPRPASPRTCSTRTGDAPVNLELAGEEWKANDEQVRQEHLVSVLPTSAEP